MIRRHRQRAARGWGDPEIWTPDSFPHSLGPNRSIATFNPTYFRRSVTPAGPAIGRGGSDYNTAITLPAASGYTCHLFVLARRSGSVSTLYGGTNAYRINGGAIGSGTPSLLAAATTAISLSQTLTAGSVIFGRWKNTDYLLAHRNAAGIIEWGTSSSSLSDGGPVDIGRASDDAFALIARWVNATPTDAQIRMLLDNPWALLRRSREAVFSVAGDGAITGTASFTESSDTASASGQLIHRGTAAFSETNDTAAVSGRLIHYGSAAFTESNDTAAATGSVGTTGVYGDVAFAESDDILAALGRIIHRGTATITEADDTFAAVGRLIHRGTGSFIEDDDTLTASDADPLHGFTQDQLDFLVAYMEANMAIPTVEQIAAAVLAASVETGATVAESLRLSNAVLGGKVSGAGTGTETFRNPADTKDRIVATVDSSGNRTAITLDLD